MPWFGNAINQVSHLSRIDGRNSEGESRKTFTENAMEAAGQDEVLSCNSRNWWNKEKKVLPILWIWKSFVRKNGDRELERLLIYQIRSKGGMPGYVEVVSDKTKISEQMPKSLSYLCGATNDIVIFPILRSFDLPRCIAKKGRTQWTGDSYR